MLNIKCRAVENKDMVLNNEIGVYHHTYLLCAQTARIEIFEKLLCCCMYTQFSLSAKYLLAI